MSSADYWNGMRFGDAAGRDKARRLRTTIGEWQNYAAELEAQLDKAKIIIADKAAREAGRNAQQLELRKALAGVAPNHPLLSNEASQLRAIGNAEMVNEYARRGFDFDLTTKTLKRRR